MSAITGIYSLQGPQDNREHGTLLMSGLRSYPADLIHTWQSGGVFLGCHAQTVAPEAVYECLPYEDTKRKLTITADALLDNREELFGLLQVESGRRQTIPDSKLILLAYEKWGTDAPKYLVGDFAFMIWDERNRRLFGARDFSGCRTLYYFRDSERFAFCTVIRPLLLLPFVKKELNESWVAEYLAISGMIDTVDTDSTVYRSIHQLPPSHSIVVTAGGIKLERYCTLTSGERLKLKSDGEYIEAFRAVFQEAVASRVRTNRPVGAQLSGGLDSGSVVGFAVQALRERNKPLHTFSYVPSRDFEDYTGGGLMADETDYIQSTVRHVGDINDHYLDFAGRDSFSEVPDFLNMMEMPYKFFENSFWLKGIYEKAAELNIGVLLNAGRGNLSISWGHAINHYAVLMKKFKWLRLAREVVLYDRNMGFGKKRLLKIIAREAYPALDRAFPAGEPYRLPTLINPGFAERTGVYEKLQEFGFDRTGWFAGTDIYEQRRQHFAQLCHWNASNTLATKLSLRYGLVKRDPTNDLRVIRFCLSVPEEQYVRNGLDRALIRRSTERILPDKVRLNQKFHGVQGADWIHRMLPAWDAFREEARQLSADRDAMAYLNGPVIANALAKAEQGARPESAVDPDFRVLMRSLIFYKFMKIAFA